MPLNEFELRELFNQPVLLSEREGEFIKGFAAAGLSRLRDTPDQFLADLNINGEPLAYGDYNQFGFGQNQVRPYPVVSGVAVIDINGVLLHRETWWGRYYTGYESIVMRASMAAEDESVKGILFRINSGGGMVAECFETCDALKAVSESKPIWSFVSPWCCSAAYALASSTNKICVMPSAQAGSIGVLLMHIEVSKLMDDFGVKVTFIHAGKHKVEGNMFEPLPEAVQNKWQTQINKLYEKFTGVVAENRGLDIDAVKATEADVFDADQLLSLGLADEIAVYDDVIGNFEASFENQLNDEEIDMTTETDKDKATKQQADQQLADAKADAKATERARISAITGSEKAKGREKLASHLAMNTEMDADQAIAVLENSPKEAVESPASKQSDFQQAMSSGSPALEPEVDGDTLDEQAAEEDQCFSLFDQVHKKVS